jgi:hypothetical protein
MPERGVLALECRARLSWSRRGNSRRRSKSGGVSFGDQHTTRGLDKRGRGTLASAHGIGRIRSRAAEHQSDDRARTPANHHLPGARSTTFPGPVPIADEDATWNMLLFVIKSRLTGTPVTLSALASVANVPHATAMRRIQALIESGHIETAAFRDARKVSYLPQPRGPGCGRTAFQLRRASACPQTRRRPRHPRSSAWSRGSQSATCSRAGLGHRCPNICRSRRF